MASIKKYSSKGQTKWKIRILVGRDELTGKQKVKTKQGFKSKKAAQLAVLELESSSCLNTSKTSLNSPVTTSSITFKQVYLEWFKLYQNTVKESTWIKTKEIFKLHILPILGNRKLNTITDVLCQKAVNHWYDERYTKFKVWINNVSRIFKFAKRKHIISLNPVENILIPKRTNVRTMTNNYYDKEELKQFLDCLYDLDDYQAYAFFRLLAFSGLRKGEALALYWKDINFSQKIVSVTKTQSRGVNGINVQTPKTYESNRNVFLDTKTINILKKWKKCQSLKLKQLGYSYSTSQLIFSNTRNTMLQPVKPTLWLKRVTENYNLKHITTHGFRHTYATLAFESGLSVKQVQLQLGHRDIQTTLDIYTAVTNKQKNEIADKFSAYVNF
ncbi:tyrosine-type recombinase/integrase [Liquorilactobacillus oeni]|uniref:Tyr recombinase domain-containing protein n=1 Tax=Liquorilactobacillus oeni DSM 19972 TaxID=1423777 RepID=A0A0R1MGH9_9LACO|nr:tyrosine-type recombinase/integrase [Liquorilactobacillus oeni]KRL05012.1 hypothetical protein FD46_GL001237 [Liquorilactobacillus oeni DSM 19972]